MEYYKNLDVAPIKYFCEFDQIWKVEEFRDIPDYEGYYQASDLGRIKSLGNNKYKKDKILKGSLDKNGYKRLGLMLNKKQKMIQTHQLVCIAFLNHIPCGMDLVVNHKNFITIDNRKLNLEIVTSRENSNRKHLKSSSEYIGVSWDKQNKKWISSIVFNAKKIHLGYFTTEKEASEYYENALISIKNKTEIKRKPTNFTSIYKGVSWSKNEKKWVCQITINKKKLHIGYFKNEIEAHNAYQNKLKSQ